MVNRAADTDAQVVRISMDAKATVKVGDFSRGGKKRVRVKAVDHDFTATFIDASTIDRWRAALLTPRGQAGGITTSAWTVRVLAHR